MLEEEQAVQAALAKLNQQIENNEVIAAFREIEKRVQDNQKLTALVAAIKQAQQDAVQFAHYGKPEAEKQALAEADRLTDEFDSHPLVVAYREQLTEANDLIQYITKRIQKEINDYLEEEGLDASKN